MVEGDNGNGAVGVAEALRYLVEVVTGVREDGARNSPGDPHPPDAAAAQYTFDESFRLADALKAMGMSSAFDPAAADFSGMDGRSCRAGDHGCLYIREVVHKGFVSVVEAGAGAAAATGVVMQQESGKPVSVTVDRPFVFLIRDHPTGTVLFLGRVMEP